MPQLKDLWVGMETRDREDAGTDSKILLTVITNNRERLRHTFTDTFQEDQERGQANLYPVDVAGKGIDSDSLTSDSIVVRMEGDDQWSPRHIVVWGRSNSGAVIPLAMKTEITDKISGDKEGDEGPDNLAIPKVVPGGADVRINRLLMLMLTADAPDSGTPDEISLQVLNGGSLVAEFRSDDSSQADQDTSQANLYFVPVKSAFTKKSLVPGSIKLRTSGRDAWTPSQFFLFGLRLVSGRLESVVPLVHIPSWKPGLPSLSKAASEGAPFVDLPLA
jgi:hypothetical protein